MNLQNKKKASSARAGAEQQKEVELKLHTDPEGMAILLETPRLLAAARDGKRTHMHAVYYDTPTMTLNERGACLRVRDEDGRYVQTVKSAGRRAGTMDREERKVEVPGFEPHPEWLDTVTAVAGLDGDQCGELRAVFTTKYDRLVSLLTYCNDDGRSSLIEIACDRGVIRSDAGELPILEIELELLQGDPGALYDLALELHQHYPLHVGTRSKSDRGYGLISGAPPPWRTSEKPALPFEITIDDAIATVFRTGFSNWLTNEAAAVDGSDPEGVHQMRVALRRLRSALVVFGHFLPDEQAKWLKTECRWLADCLGPARDLDVFLTEILDPVVEANPGDRGLLGLHHRAETARAIAYETLRHAIHSPRYGRFVLDFGRWLERNAWRHHRSKKEAKRLEQPLKKRAAKLLSRQHRDVMALGEHVVTGTDEQRHDLRIAIKKLRYSIDYMPADKTDRRRRQFRQDLSRLQDDLGVMNDIAVTEARLESLIADGVDGDAGHELVRAAGQVLGWWGGIGQQRKADLGDAWEQFQSREPFWMEAV